MTRAAARRGPAAVAPSLALLFVAIPVAASAGSKPAPIRDRVHLAGAFGADFRFTKELGPSFFKVTLAPILLLRIHERILFESEIDLGYAAGAFDVRLHYAQLDFTLAEPLTVVAGLSILPLGIYGERLHPVWINRLPDAPYPYQAGHHGGPIPMSGLGVQLRGALGIGSVSALNYSAFAVNGPAQVGAEIELGGVVPDNNWNKFVGGRVGFLPARPIEIGISGGVGQWDDDVQERFAVLVGDVMAGVGGLNVQGEYVTTRLWPLEGDADQRHFWWGQAAYRLLPAPGLLNRFEFVVRYGGGALPEEVAGSEHAHVVAAAAAEAGTSRRVGAIGKGGRTRLPREALAAAGHGASDAELSGTGANAGLPAGVSQQIGGGLNFYPVASVAIRAGAHWTVLPHEEPGVFQFDIAVTAGF
jgi:hypothetical protein